MPKSKIPPGVPQKDKVDPITKKPIEEFDMMAFMKK